LTCTRVFKELVLAVAKVHAINDEAKDSNDGEEDQGTCYPSAPLHNI